MNLIRKESEYAIRILKLLSTFPDNKIIKLKEISETENISVHFTAKILRNLSRKKIVNSFQGSQGGYSLKRKKITYYEIIKAIQGEIYIVNYKKFKSNEIIENLLKTQELCVKHLNSIEIQKNTK
ncbi:Rrf2 family protein [Fusobacterium sp. PH5-7]|uniref:RrF2 family transcriptional regulator n=1 Tax=Fusobacterium sp. PH5-7 TaxID=2940528 RepID=UPI00247386D3|nr:Rrf2 family transcriptional regulator [Fusobacterium sp. PH5-7]MDH6458238.1 Rrf2 family protein [Fusobacterium sp. PH5-7]